MTIRKNAIKLSDAHQSFWKTKTNSNKNNRSKEIIKIREEIYEIEMKKHHINSHDLETDRSKLISLSLELLWSTLWVPGKQRLHRVPLSHKKKKK